MLLPGESSDDDDGSICDSFLLSRYSRPTGESCDSFALSIKNQFGLKAGSSREAAGKRAGSSREKGGKGGKKAGKQLKKDAKNGNSSLYTCYCFFCLLVSM
jgi:hypothetical protein